MSNSWPGPGTPLNEVELRLGDPLAMDLTCVFPLFLKEAYSLTQAKTLTDSGPKWPTYLGNLACLP